MMENTMPPGHGLVTRDARFDKNTLNATDCTWTVDRQI